MSIQKATIEVDVPGGWEVAGFRRPKEGETYYSDVLGRVATSVRDEDTQRRLILRPEFVWPSWLKAAAIAKDESGEVWCFSDIPTLEVVRSVEYFSAETTVELNPLLFDFAHGLENVHWRESLRINPNYKGGDE